MAITNLTNTKWLMNSITCTAGYGIFDIAYTCTHEGDDYECDTLWVGYRATGEGAVANANKAVTDDLAGDELWAGDTIEITGGTDVTNASLISWLTANATQISTATTKDITTINGYDSLAAGAHTIQIAATDSTGTRDDSTKTSYSFTKLVAPTRISGSTLLDDNFEFDTVNNSNGYKVYADNILLGVVQPITLSISPAGAATINKNYADVTSSTSDTVTLTPASGYLLPSSVTVTGATSSYNSTTGVVTLTSISGAITITATAIVESHTLTNSITNMSVSGTTIFDDGGSGTTNVSCGSAYGLPLTISVNGTAVAAGATVSTADFGCTYTMTNDRAGTLAFTGVKANLTLTGTVRETLAAPTIAFTPTYSISYSLTNMEEDASSSTSIAAGRTAGITVIADSGYLVPATSAGVTVTNATIASYTAYNESTPAAFEMQISNPTGDVTITAAGVLPSYSITTSVTNGTYSGDSTISQGGTASVTIAANSGYELPSSITVTGATYSYNSTTGVISLSSPTGNVSITVVCVLPVLTTPTIALDGNTLEIYSNDGNETSYDIYVDGSYAANVPIPSGYSVTITNETDGQTGTSFYSLDDGVTWVDVGLSQESTIQLTNVTQIKFKAVWVDTYIGYGISTQLNMHISAWTNNPDISQNYILTQNITDVRLGKEND